MSGAHLLVLLLTADRCGWRAPAGGRGLDEAAASSMGVGSRKGDGVCCWFSGSCCCRRCREARGGGDQALDRG